MFLASTPWYHAVESLAVCSGSAKRVLQEGTDLFLHISVAEDQRSCLCAARLSQNMTGQKLWGSIKPYDDAMLHVAPVLPSDDCPTASCYDAFGEGHQLLQLKEKFNKYERERERDHNALASQSCVELYDVKLLKYSL